jgi:hypothetical protein
MWLATAFVERDSPESVVTWPELDHYDKKERYEQCSKRNGVASWIRAVKSREEMIEKRRADD